MAAKGLQGDSSGSSDSAEMFIAGKINNCYPKKAISPQIKKFNY